jgi:SMC interacting uncharacterized protein involved in chromosome segregation
MTSQLDDKIDRYSSQPNDFGLVPLDEIASSLHDKLQDLQEIVADIESMIDERKSLGHKVCLDIEQELARANSFLREFEQPGAIRVGLEKIRGVFEREIFALRSEKRRELIKEWEDIARLKKDIREHSERMKEIQRKLKEARR